MFYDKETWFRDEDWWYGTPDYDKPPSDASSFNQDILMQYTNLKDKNGNEIYEGDVVMNIWKDTAIVEWCDKDLVYEPVSNIIRGNGNWDDRDKFEVIGNIYENLELLDK